MKNNRGWFSGMFHIIVHYVTVRQHILHHHVHVDLICELQEILSHWKTQVSWCSHSLSGLFYMAAQAASTLRAPRNSIILQGEVGWTCIIQSILVRLITFAPIKICKHTERVCTIGGPASEACPLQQHVSFHLCSHYINFYL